MASTFIPAHNRGECKTSTSPCKRTQTGVNTEARNHVSVGCHGGISLSCYWRRLLGWATNTDFLISPRIARSALCDMESSSTELLMCTQCELNKFVFHRDTEHFSMCVRARPCVCVRAVCVCVHVCMCVCVFNFLLIDMVSLHNDVCVMTFNWKLKISLRASTFFKALELLICNIWQYWYITSNGRAWIFSYLQLRPG